MQDLPEIKANWESAVLELFEETYPLYRKESLLLLIKSGVFLQSDYEKYTAKNCAQKLALFVLLASKADYKQKLECWSKYRDENTVKED